LGKIQIWIKHKIFSNCGRDNLSLIKIVGKNNKNVEILVKKSKFWSKIENLVKNQKFGQKSNILEIFVQNLKNICQKTKLLVKIEILVKK